MSIPKGYQLHIMTWENDSDAHMTKIISGLSKKDVKFYLDLAENFRSRNNRRAGEKQTYGNGEVNDETLAGIAKEALAANPDINPKIRKSFEFGGQIHGFNVRDILVSDILGRAASYEYRFCRVFAGFEVFHLSRSGRNMTKQFKETPTNG